jgi:putative nucleotidyltransferase with HDIG domain
VIGHHALYITVVLLLVIGELLIILHMHKQSAIVHKDIEHFVMLFLFFTERRDDSTSNHAIRVSRISMAIASFMGLSKKAQEDCAVGGLLHDIGKIAISDCILKKKDFTEQDRIQMQKHTVYGYLMARSLYSTRKVADIVLFHHERWDGKGYPMGIKSAVLPVESRIVSFADAFDAMYKRNKMSFAKVCAEIKRNSGTQFDPDIVKVFFEHQEQIKDIADKEESIPFDMPAMFSMDHAQIERAIHSYFIKDIKNA